MFNYAVVAHDCPPRFIESPLSGVRTVIMSEVVGGVRWGENSHAVYNNYLFVIILIEIIM